jgi:hypothetical protein
MARPTTLALVLLCTLAGLSLVPSLARADGTGKITGTVTDAGTGDQLEAIGVCARLIGTGGASCVTTGDGIGGEPGKYEIGALAGGSYEVEFFQGSFENTYLVQFWDDKESQAEAEPVSVIEGQTTSGIDAAMHEGGKISGTVTAALDGAPIAGIRACAVESTAPGSQIECTETDVAGDYTIRGLYDGSYKVQFTPAGLHCNCATENYRTQYYSGVETWLEAVPISVAVGTTRGGIDARMVSANKEKLTVSLTGDGSGTVAGSPAGIDCGTTCTAEFQSGETVTLTATAAHGSHFGGWSGGGCSGTATTCKVTMGEAQAVTADFSLDSHALQITTKGSGAGEVGSSPTGIQGCGASGGSCQASYDYGTVVTLTAKPAAGSAFAGWSGAGCSGTGICQVTMNADARVTATFRKTPGGGGPPNHPHETRPPAPNTRIVGVRVNSVKRKATFKFKAVGTATRFRCRLKRQGAKARVSNCVSPKAYRHLRPGRYLFSVRAIGPGGSDPTPATRRFRVSHAR